MNWMKSCTSSRVLTVYITPTSGKSATNGTESQNRGAALAVNEVMTAIGRWAQDERALRSGLENICDKALKCWALARQVEDRIWPEFEYELPEDWQPLPLLCWPAAPTVNTPNRKKMPKTDNNNSQNGAPNHEPRQLLKSEVKVVWPTIFAAEPQVPGSSDATTLERLHCGYVLTQAQSQDAEEEISHRAARRTRRADSVPHKN
ncbi:hypothetical protein CRV24_001557 [Beauveria bassiana]|nr:hypothetical protein CRV24_001557 [Beauveria bassiana]